MRTTIEIDEKLLKEIMILTGASTKRKAVKIALENLKKALLREELIKLIGNYDSFDLSIDELERKRNEK